MANKRTVIMQILPALESGGVERGTVDIAKALKNIDFEPIVVSSGGALIYQLKEAGVKHITLPVHSKNPFTVFRNIAKIERLIKDFEVDIVHVRSRAPMWSAYYACQKTKTKLVSTVHGTYSLKFLKWKVFPLKRIYNTIMLKADAIIVVSNFIKQYLLDNYQTEEFLVPLDKITVIQRGVDLKNFDSSKITQNPIIALCKKWNLPEDKQIILMPARFTAWKGHEFLINALTKVRSDFCCVLVGSDHGHKKFRKYIEAKILKENLGGKVKLVGVQRDMSVAYAAANLVICPSVKPEAFGRVAIEAQAASRVIIATNIGGSLETIIDKETGFLVDVGDVDKLAELIDNVLKMPKAEVDAIGAKARKHMEQNFSNEKMCNDTIALYRNILNK